MMSGFEIFETAESMESTGIAELQEQREQLCTQADAALESGNVERANYFQGEIAHLDEQISRLTSGMDSGEITLGEGHSGGHSESYWKEAAAKELAEHGKTTWYEDCKKQLEEAIKNDAK